MNKDGNIDNLDLNLNEGNWKPIKITLISYLQLRGKFNFPSCPIMFFSLISVKPS